TFLDFLAVIIYLPVLLLYSWQLTLIVLGVSATAFVVLAAMSRTFRKRLTEVNEIEGRRKAFLFEILNGIATIKTLALEPRSMLRWRRHTEEAASKSLSLDHTAAGARSVVTSLERGMSVGIGALGALFVLSDQMDRRRARRLQYAGTAAGAAADPCLLLDAGLSALGAVIEAPRPTDADGARTVERPARPDHPRPHRVRQSDLSLSGIADPGGQGNLVRRRARPDCRHRRPQRLGQDDDHPADPGTLSAAGRPRKHRRPGSEGARSGASAHPDRGRLAGEFSVPRHRAREYCNDQAGRFVGRSRPSGAAG